ncbi:MAG: phosphotransferase [Firmicutes bacterium]|nr:phosphotransferase [Bacillota bacterium]
MAFTIPEEIRTTFRPGEEKEIDRLLLLLTTASQAEIEDFSIMGGGLTNRNYKVTLTNGKKIAMRIAGQGTDEYLNRSAEKRNASLVSGLGINAEIYFFDLKTGSQLSHFITGRTLTPEDFQNDREILKKTAEIMNKYHNCGQSFADDFDPLRETRTYAKILRASNFTEFYEGYDIIKKRLLDVAEAYINCPQKKVPCHNDPLSANFMEEGDRLYLIDWEYAGMNDPTFDLAAIINENCLDDETAEYFLECYYGGELTEEQRARVHISRFVADALWACWSLVQINSGKDRDLYWDYGQDRVNWCMKFINHPKFDDYLKLIGFVDDGVYPDFSTLFD